MLPNCNTSVSNTSSGVENMIKKCLHWQGDKKKSSQHLWTVTLCHSRMWPIIPVSTCLFEEVCIHYSGVTVSITIKHTKSWSSRKSLFHKVSGTSKSLWRQNRHAKRENHNRPVKVFSFINSPQRVMVKYLPEGYFFLITKMRCFQKTSQKSERSLQKSKTEVRTRW